MPLYEYDCKSCQKTVEILVRSLDEQPECPDCGGEQLEKLLSAPSAPSVKGSQKNLPVAREGCGAPSCCAMRGGGHGCS